MRYRIALAGVLLGLSVGCGGYSSPSSPTPSSGGTGGGSPVSIVSGASTKTTTAYSPSPITISVGGTVTWTNNDNTTHTSTADGGLWTSGSIGPGGSFSYKFPTAGTFQYHCSIHPGMVGTVTVQ